MTTALSTPLADAVIDGLTIGDHVTFSGVIYTARDAAHKRLIELMKRGEQLPVDLRGQVIYYVGPTPPRPGAVIGSAGPTTSMRLDPYTLPMLELGLKGIIGKGGRGPEIRAAIKDYHAVYCIAVGGTGALLNRHIKSAEVVAFEDLGYRGHPPPRSGRLPRDRRERLPRWRPPRIRQGPVPHHGPSYPRGEEPRLTSSRRPPWQRPTLAPKAALCEWRFGARSTLSSMLHRISSRTRSASASPPHPSDWRQRPDMDAEGTRLFRASIVARARYIEDLVAEKAEKGATQYVILGAGLDTFAERRPNLASRLTVFEVDRPEPQEWKRRRLHELGLGPPEWLRLVPVDFESGQSWRTALIDAGFAVTGRRWSHQPA